MKCIPIQLIGNNLKETFSKNWRHKVTINLYLPVKQKEWSSSSEQL
jgi:hypothetical protein